VSDGTWRQCADATGHARGCTRTTEPVRHGRRFPTVEGGTEVWVTASLAALIFIGGICINSIAMSFGDWPTLAEHFRTHDKFPYLGFWCMATAEVKGVPADYHFYVAPTPRGVHLQVGLWPFSLCSDNTLLLIPWHAIARIVVNKSRRHLGLARIRLEISKPLLTLCFYLDEVRFTSALPPPILEGKFASE